MIGFLAFVSIVAAVVSTMVDYNMFARFLKWMKP